MHIIGTNRLKIWGDLHVSHVIFPHEYIALLIVSFLDIVFTWVILSLGGTEINPIMNIVLLAHGLLGMILVKFAIILLVIILCEEVGRRHLLKGRRLVRVTVAIGLFPVVVGLTQLTLYCAMVII